MYIKYVYINKQIEEIYLFHYFIFLKGVNSIKLQDWVSKDQPICNVTVEISILDT